MVSIFSKLQYNKYVTTLKPRFFFCWEQQRTVALQYHVFFATNAWFCHIFFLLCSYFTEKHAVLSLMVSPWIKTAIKRFGSFCSEFSPVELDFHIYKKETFYIGAIQRDFWMILDESHVWQQAAVNWHPSNNGWPEILARKLVCLSFAFQSAIPTSWTNGYKEISRGHGGGKNK